MVIFPANYSEVESRPRELAADKNKVQEDRKVSEVSAVIEDLMHRDHPLCSSRQPDQGKPSNNPTKKSHSRTVRVRVRVRVLPKENFLTDANV